MSIFCILPFLIYINCVASEKKLLLVSLDGFRNDFLTKYKAPNLKKLVESGIHAKEGMIPSFPTNTLSNHRTLATGLYPDLHGMLGNRMYDPLFNDYFFLKFASKYRSDKWWNASRPIWESAIKSGINIGLSFWPGGVIDQDSPFTHTDGNSIVHIWDKKPFKDRVDVVIKWLVEKKVQFAALYFEEPIDKARAFGPDSPQVAKAVEDADNIVGYLVESLKKAKLFDRTNIIVTSGQGMSSVNLNQENALVLSNEVADDDLQFIPLLPRGSPMVDLLPKEGKEDKVFNALYNVHPRIKIYRKEDIPDRFHFRNNRRIMPIVAMAEEGYYISYKGSGYLNDTVVGMDGYDNQLKNMRTLFVASGPNFKKGVQIEAFENVDVYPLMCHLLGIAPNPSNGSLTTFESVLKSISVGTKPSLFLVIAVSISSFYVAINSRKI